MKVKGIWLTNTASDLFQSPDNINLAILVIAETGFNVIFPVVWNKGYTLYPSEIMSQNFGNNFKIDPLYGKNNRNPLQEIITAAKKVNLKVIPWFEYGFTYSHTSVNHVNKYLLESRLKEKNWLAYDWNGNILVKNGFQWLNAFNSQVQNFILDLLLEVVKNYEVDGIQGDDRLPAFPGEGVYNSTDTLAKLWNKILPDFFLQQKANLLTNFWRQVHQEVKKINPNLIISIAPNPDPFALREYLQDWKTWLNYNLVDVIHPQLYARSYSKYQSLCQANLTKINQKDQDKFFPGVLLKIGNFRLSKDDLWSIIKYNRNQGIKGEVFFFWEGLKDNDFELAKFLQSQQYYKV
jgi:uncharacterized lipoprotein YddW (UPF0748 family)